MEMQGDNQIQLNSTFTFSCTVMPENPSLVYLLALGDLLRYVTRISTQRLRTPLIKSWILIRWKVLEVTADTLAAECQENAKRA